MYNWIKNTLMMTRSIQPISLTTTLTQTRSSAWTCLPRKCPSGSIGKHERYKNLCRAGIPRWFAKDRIPLIFLSSSAVYHFSNHIYDQYFQGNRCSQNQVPCSWENWDNKTGTILMMTFFQWQIETSEILAGCSTFAQNSLFQKHNDYNQI